jgi:hypothetical protein
MICHTESYARRPIAPKIIQIAKLTALLSGRAVGWERDVLVRGGKTFDELVKFRRVRTFKVPDGNMISPPHLTAIQMAEINARHERGLRREHAHVLTFRQ